VHVEAYANCRGFGQIVDQLMNSVDLERDPENLIAQGIETTGQKLIFQELLEPGSTQHLHLSNNE
jgi:hypothetical protein